jgi:hypothetical protein
MRNRRVGIDHPIPRASSDQRLTLVAAQGATVDEGDDIVGPPPDQVVACVTAVSLADSGFLVTPSHEVELGELPAGGDSSLGEDVA